MKKLILYSALFLLLYKVCYKATDGFCLRKIQTDLKGNSEWISDGEKIPDQPFFYMGHGVQTYAFVSKDGKYVLKFYRHNRAGHPLHFLAPLLPKKIKEQLKATIVKRKNKRLKDFSSYCLAYRYLAKETGLLHLHLNPTKTPLSVTLYDKIGVRHFVNLNQMQFILQKRAAPLYQTLKKWIAEEKINQTKLALSQLIVLIKNRCKMGIFDKDPNLKTNFGFIEDEPIQFDIGRFKIDPKRAEQNVYQGDLIRITDRLCKWLDEKAPCLSKHIQEEIAKE